MPQLEDQDETMCRHPGGAHIITVALITCTACGKHVPREHARRHQYVRR